MTIKYKVFYTKRKSLAIVIKNNGDVNVRAPKYSFFDNSKIDEFVNSKKEWIVENVEKMKKNIKERRPELSPKEKKEKKEEARKIIFDKIEYFAEKYGFKYSKLRLSSAKTRWGSCSGANTISINWNLIFAPTPIMDYVIIHELCHTKHHNHSNKFWTEVEKYVPDYKKKREWLKENEHKIQ